MVSKRRDELKKFVDEEGTFIAIINYVSYEKKMMILNDVAIEGENFERIIIAKHLNVYRVNSKVLSSLKQFDIITFKARACDYRKKRMYGNIKNFGLENVRNIRKVCGVYNGK